MSSITEIKEMAFAKIFGEKRPAYDRRILGAMQWVIFHPHFISFVRDSHGLYVINFKAVNGSDGVGDEIMRCAFYRAVLAMPAYDQLSGQLLNNTEIDMAQRKEREKPKQDKDPKTEPDWNRNCENCGETPVVPATGLCGPCTFGEADTVGGNW